MYVNRKTVDEIKNSLPLWLQDYYLTTQIDRVKIDGIEFTGNFEISDLDEITFFKEPLRSSSGSIDNLNSYARFLTPHLLIRYKFMNIEEYRTLMKLMQSKAEFVVEYYNLVWDKRVQHKMYFIPSTMPKVYQKMLRALGILDYSVEMVGTNTDIEKINITYNTNPPNSTVASEVIVQNPSYISMLMGKDAKIGEINIQDMTFGGNYKFQKWCDKADGSGFSYLDNNEYFLKSDTKLYAIWAVSA